jgi:hypothetical protein
VSGAWSMRMMADLDFLDSAPRSEAAAGAEMSQSSTAIGVSSPSHFARHVSSRAFN